MSWVAAAIVGSSVVGGLLSSESQFESANAASNAQVASSAAGIAEQQRQFNAVRDLLKPYVDAGGGALFGQRALLGLNGRDAQAQAISGIESSPAFASMTQQGENAILSNASATGGLRGGNTQAAFAQFRPALLSSLIQQQFHNLGGLTSIGQNAAAGVGNAGMNTGNQITSLLQQQGAAQAGGALANGRANANAFGAVGGGLGLFSGLGGFGNAANGAAGWNGFNTNSYLDGSYGVG